MGDIDWDALAGLAVTVPRGSSFWRGTGHSPESLGEGATLRAFSWLSTTRHECSSYARVRKGQPDDGPWMCRYEAVRDLRALSLVAEEGGAPMPDGVAVGDPVFLAELSARGFDLLLYGERSFHASRLGYWDHVRPLSTGLLSLAEAHRTSPEIEGRLHEEALAAIEAGAGAGVPAP